MTQHGIPRFYGDWKEMLDRERPDFVDIITPPETHEEMCGFAAARGIHIICQKPLAPTYEASQRIVLGSALRTSGSWSTRTSAGSRGIARSRTFKCVETSATSRTSIS